MRRLIPLLVGLVVGVVCVRLGIWQLDRLAQRRAYNAARVTRRAMEPLFLPLPPALSADTLAGRRAVAEGRFDFAHEIVDVARSYRATPGVYLLTPLVLDSGGVVLVNRGWVFAADGMTVDRSALEEPGVAVVEGLFLAPVRSRRAVRPDTLPLGQPVFPLILLRTDPPDSLPPGLVLLDPPVLDDGPHLSYAIQWFSFAVIAVVGSAVLVTRRPRA